MNKSILIFLVSQGILGIIWGATMTNDMATLKKIVNDGVKDRYYKSDALRDQALYDLRIRSLDEKINSSTLQQKETVVEMKALIARIEQKLDRYVFNVRRENRD